jgi:hypothetical protein
MFIEIIASKGSLARRSLIHGVAINDADYITQPKINGKIVRCPFYRKWTHMLDRCYSEKYHDRRPTYKGCTVSEEWLVFSNFRDWMIKQDWEGRELDKDILVQGNKEYSPKACIFVSSAINGLLSDHRASRGPYPIGMSWSKSNNKFKATCSITGKQVHLGHFDTIEEAHKAYKEFKYNLIRDIALQQKEPLKTALLNFKIEGY